MFARSASMLFCRSVLRTTAPPSPFLLRFSLPLALSLPHPIQSRSQAWTGPNHGRRLRPRRHGRLILWSRSQSHSRIESIESGRGLGEGNDGDRLRLRDRALAGGAHLGSDLPHRAAGRLPRGRCLSSLPLRGRLRCRLVLLPAARPPAVRRGGAPPRAAVQEGALHAPLRRPRPPCRRPRGHVVGQGERHKCYMLSVRALCIIWSDTPRYWRWIPLTDSRFAEAAELLAVCWLEICGKMRSQMPDPTMAAADNPAATAASSSAWSNGWSTARAARRRAPVPSASIRVALHTRRPASSSSPPARIPPRPAPPRRTLPRAPIRRSSPPRLPGWSRRRCPLAGLSRSSATASRSSTPRLLGGGSRLGQQRHCGKPRGRRKSAFRCFSMRKQRSCQGRQRSAEDCRRRALHW